MEKVFVSACFMGEYVRYDGGHQLLTHKMLKQWQEEKRIISGCPECLGGLPVPRAPAEIQPRSAEVITVTGDNVTEFFHRGAIKALDICVKHNIRYALLKESSPSCGSTTIYDGTFSSRKIQGKGITAQLFIQQGIEVFSEQSIDVLIEKMQGKA